MSDRVKKVAEGLKRQISVILSSKIQDPVIEDVTVRAVDISPDLKNARVSYVYPLGESENVKKVYRHMRRAGSFIRKELAKDMAMKHVPRIRFVEDKSRQKREDLEELYKKIRQKEGTDEK